MNPTAKSTPRQGIVAPKAWAENPDLGDGEFGDAANPKRKLVSAGEPFERSLAQLRSYCGHGDATRRRRAGMTQEDAFALGSPKCKMLVHLLAESVVMAQTRALQPTDREFAPVGLGGIYGMDVKYSIGALGTYFLHEKAKYAARTHTGDCPGGYGNAHGRVVLIRCKVTGPDGVKHYAQAGDPYQASHVHAIGLRHLGKQLLRELWEASA